jgi:hypothetical protein
MVFCNKKYTKWVLLYLFLIVESFSSYATSTEPMGLAIFRKAYPDVVFGCEFDNSYRDWKITISVGGRSGVLYWSEGRMLPENKLSQKENYRTLLYTYQEDVFDPANFTDEDIANIQEYASEESRNSGPITGPYFFDLIYDCKSQISVEEHIIKEYFLGKRLNIHERIKIPLEAVEREIKTLAKTDDEVKVFVDKLAKADGYYWRTIRDTESRSFHSIGIAVDILPIGWNRKNIYWGWRRDMDPDNWMKTPLDHRWMPPAKVIEIFEKHGFIWGGKWIIWDDMHFEYHPELIIYNEYKKSK